ncbi:hypothetical protein RhiJN_03713 [Ceratobasidium sp. AG-Ba]|nr:hypothetical protein RhiJN_03713 [Ceratobasidium sp. AG-Ba]
METSDQHPVGIIAKVAGDRISLAGGKTSSFPHKVIREMWNRRITLLGELSAQELTSPSTTSREQYEKLLLNSSDWVTVLRLFKINTFTTGLKLTVPLQKSISLSQPSETGSNGKCLPRVSTSMDAVKPVAVSLADTSLIESGKKLDDNSVQHAEGCLDLVAEPETTIQAEQAGRSKKRPRVSKYQNYSCSTPAGQNILKAALDQLIDTSASMNDVELESMATIINHIAGLKEGSQRQQLIEDLMLRMSDNVTLNPPQTNLNNSN